MSRPRKPPREIMAPPKNLLRRICREPEDDTYHLDFTITGERVLVAAIVEALTDAHRAGARAGAERMIDALRIAEHACANLVETPRDPGYVVIQAGGALQAIRAALASEEGGL